MDRRNNLLDQYLPDIQYGKLVHKILTEGYSDKGMDVRPRYITDGEPAHTKYLIGEEFFFPPEILPLLTQKKVAIKSALREILWIWQMKSNDVRVLREELGSNVWNEWERKDGTIGKAYGHQMGKEVRTNPETLEKLDQVDFLLYALKKNPMSRRHITSLWNINDLEDMELQPCVYETHWVYSPDNKLHLIVTARSSDVALGLPFNIYQYAQLHRLFARHLGMKLGGYRFRMDIPHIYDRHEEGLREQIYRPIYSRPATSINPSVKNFYDIKEDDVEVYGYKHGKKIEFELAE